MTDNLREGRKHFERRAWREAYESLSTADATTTLRAEELELLATSAYLIGRDREFHETTERAYRAHRSSGDVERAARCCFWLGLMLLLGGEVGQAGAWLARARRLVEEVDCVERGYLMLPAAEEQLGRGDAEAAYKTAAQAVECGARFDDADLVSCARHLQGRALIRREKVHAGLQMLDEAMLAAVGGELSPIMTGLIYCSLVAACQEVFALGRAREWTNALARWCDEQPQMAAFTGVCSVYRAQIKQLSGEWREAEAEVRRACERSTRSDEAKPPAIALYQQAELHRLHGDLAKADDSYREAARLGLEPQPGLALLRLAQGRTDAACAGIRRALSTATDPLRRARLLPACVEILLSTGDVEAAHSACRELSAIAKRFDTDVLHALAADARGAVGLDAGDPQSALVELRRAFELWQRVRAPYEAARTRVRLGLACRSVGDDEAAELELHAAGATFQELGAVPVSYPAATTTVGGASAHRHPLTRREFEVLRLVVDGMTNKSIAAALHVSERTVDRHVSNILTKLGVASRTAATTYAYRHNFF